MVANPRLIRVPPEFHSMIVALERAHRDLARLEAGAPLEDGGNDPDNVEDAYRIISKQRKWLYEYAEDNIPCSEKHFRLLRFT